jgi:hypothetical protein
MSDSIEMGINMTQHGKTSLWIIGLVLGIMGWTGIASGQSTALPSKGSTLPRLILKAPESPEACAYLNVAAGKPFSLTDVGADLILVEIIGVYCPQCHKQRPHINRLYHRVQKTPNLAEKIKFLGIAVGASPMEAAYLVKDTHIPYPVITDESFAVHKQLGEPRTPFNLVTTRQGHVLWVHLGIIKDMNAFYDTLRSLAGH